MPKITIFDANSNKLCKLAKIPPDLEGELRGNLFFPNDDWGKLFTYRFEKEKSCCYICKISIGLTKHHVIPKRILKRYSKKLRDLITSFFIVILCRNCHDLYEKRVIYKDCEPLGWVQHFLFFCGANYDLKPLDSLMP